MSTRDKPKQAHAISYLKQLLGVGMRKEKEKTKQNTQAQLQIMAHQPWKTPEADRGGEALIEEG